MPFIKKLKSKLDGNNNELFSIYLNHFTIRSIQTHKVLWSYTLVFSNTK